MSWSTFHFVLCVCKAEHFSTPIWAVLADVSVFIVPSSNILTMTSTYSSNDATVFQVSFSYFPTFTVLCSYPHIFPCWWCTWMKQVLKRCRFFFPCFPFLLLRMRKSWDVVGFMEIKKKSKQIWIEQMIHRFIYWSESWIHKFVFSHFSHLSWVHFNQFRMRAIHTHTHVYIQICIYIGNKRENLQNSHQWVPWYRDWSHNSALLR